MGGKLNTDIEVIRERIFELLDASPYRVSSEILHLLEQYWERTEVDFGTKMEPWKAGRMFEIQWSPPILKFRIERHPSEWTRVQRWMYDFNSSEATLLSEWAPPLNPNYTTEQVHNDAEQIVNAVLQGKPHPSVQRKGRYCIIWMGRLPQTKPVPCQLPMRTARGRQRRLKLAIAKLVEMRGEFERVPDQESTGSLVYKLKN